MKQTQYDAVIEKILLKLQTLEVGSAEYIKCLDQLNKCVELSQKFDTINIEKEKTLIAKRTDKSQKIDLAIKCLGIGVGAFIQIWGFSNLLNFEVTNTFTSKLASPMINLLTRGH